jgi:hypothetical protein
MNVYYFVKSFSQGRNTGDMCIQGRLLFFERLETDGWPWANPILCKNLFLLSHCVGNFITYGSVNLSHWSMNVLFIINYVSWSCYVRSNIVIYLRKFNNDNFVYITFFIEKKKHIYSEIILEILKLIIDKSL